MAVTVLLDAPSPSTGARWVRAAGTLLGGLFVLIGLVACISAFVLSFIVLLAEFLTNGDAGSGAVVASWHGIDLGSVRIVWWGAVMTAVLGLTLGVRLVRGRRRLVLFLRRFGHTAATHAATVAAASIGGRWRLVTLDDAQIVPVGVGPMYDALSAAGRGGALGGAVLRRIYDIAARVVGTVLLLSFLGAAIDVGLAVASGSDIRDLLNADTTATRVLWALVGIVALAYGVYGLAWVVAASAMALRMLFFPLLAIGGHVANSVRDAEGSKALTVPDVHAIVTARERAKRLSRQVFSPRLVVLRVDSSVWQQTVNGVASVADVPLIDISEPTENVLWEIEQLNARFGPRCVFVGEYPRVVHLGTPAPTDPGAQQVQRLLDGRTILAYTTDDAGTRRFTRALLATLEQSLRIPMTGPPAPDALPRQLVIDARREALAVRRRTRRRLRIQRYAAAQQGDDPARQ
jgi:hypothetical protein